MSIPPDPPSNQPNQPQMPSKNNKRVGTVAAIAAVVLISLIADLLGGRGTGLIAVPVVSLACVILGSILTISERTRQFAVGFLITGAILLFVSAGVCVALIALLSGSFG